MKKLLHSEFIITITRKEIFMKKVIVFLSTLCILLSNFAYQIFAEEELSAQKNAFDFPVSQETPMPNPNSRIALSAWIEETKIYLEDFYNKKIIDVEETDDEVIFHFERLGQLGVESDQEIISSIYTKNSNRALQTKVNVLETYGPVTEELNVSAITWSVAKTLAISYLGYNRKLADLVAMILDLSITGVESIIVASMPVTGRVDSQKKYYQHVGYTYEVLWTPRCVVGKYEHYKTEQTYIYKTNSLAERYVKDWNYHTGGQKNHYGDSTWIVNKALEMQSVNQVYYDAYN